MRRKTLIKVVSCWLTVVRNNAAESDSQLKKTKVKISSNVKQEKGEEKNILHFTFYLLPGTESGRRTCSLHHVKSY